MTDGKFRLKSKEQIDKLTAQEKARYFQELTKTLKPRDGELEELNPGLIKRGRARKPGKRDESQGD